MEYSAMRQSPWRAIVLFFLLPFTGFAQEPPPSLVQPMPETAPAEPRARLGPPEPNLGPAPVDQSRLLQHFLQHLFHIEPVYDPSTGKEKDPPIKIYGWVDMGYTYSSSGSGQLSVEPRPNHFGREFTMN